MKRILFLCSGNYYRSRFSEELFNHLVKQEDIEWQADSRGLVKDITSLRNEGPISKYARDWLNKTGVNGINLRRMPKSVTEEDWEKADKVIAVYEKEHKPMIQTHWPEKLERTEFWDAPDIYEIDADVTLNNLENKIKLLVHQLKTTKDTTLFQR
ncbi:MAG: low molecular weight phosphatase family protein [Bacteroidetes bacterium]|jgi:protein-tyrosine phosphatase|nr:low molecular weight phosphatase family protein [Bacteroidota bacterium]